jgi:hypothetical protein
MPVGIDHDMNDVVDVVIRHVFLEEVAHAVYEDLPWGRPLERLVQFLGDEAQVEPLLIGMAWYATKAFSEGLGVAMLATRTDFRAAAKRIPGSIGPFDFGMLAQFRLASNEGRTFRISADCCGL